MTQNLMDKKGEKPNLHPRNPHRARYDFPSLVKSVPKLKHYVKLNEYGTESIEFADPDAVKTLNNAILNHFYRIKDWDIPEGYLCPPIPGRADYIHYLADLLTENGQIPKGEKIRGLDIGVGANCVYPVIGHLSYGWSFVGVDIDKIALDSAQRIIQRNSHLESFIDLRLQNSSTNIFKGVVEPADRFDFTMCNPPFHSSLEEAIAGTKRKWKNLGLNKKKDSLNFGGQHSELWCPGGEQTFIGRIIEQSCMVQSQCKWFTSLVSKNTTLPALYKLLKKVQATDVKTIEMSQGQKVSRILAWTFAKN